MKKPNRKKWILVFLLCTVMAAGVAFGCAGKSAASVSDEAYVSHSGSYNYTDAYAPEEPMEYTVGMTLDASAENASVPIDAEKTSSSALDNRKIIRNANIDVQTLEFDKFVEALNDAVAKEGGFIESSNVGGRTYYSSRLRSASFVIRVPANRLEAFLDTVGNLGNVTSKSTNLRDVTTKYVDSEKHLEALRTEQEALLEILKKAETVEDIITVQDRLSYVKYEIESYEAILRTYDDQVEMSTVSLYLDEVEHETVTEPETFWEEVSRRFNNSLENVRDGFLDFSSWILGNAPEIIVFLVINAAIVLIIVFSIRGGIRRRAKRRAKKLAQQQQQQQQ